MVALCVRGFRFPGRSYLHMVDDSACASPFKDANLVASRRLVQDAWRMPLITSTLETCDTADCSAADVEKVFERGDVTGVVVALGGKTSEVRGTRSTGV